MQRTIMVSNRLPVTLERVDGVLVGHRSMGGLATGLGGVHQQTKGLWIGWSGLSSAGALTQPSAEETALLAQHGCVPVPLTADEVENFYEGFSNGVLWPAFHCLTDRLPLQGDHFETYRQVNARVAQVVAQHATPEDLVWIHDYQLLLVPGMLRALVPGVRVGFFLHIPFPPAEIFSLLPWRDQLLEGMLGADLVGFHTHGYARAFFQATSQNLGTSTNVDRIMVGPRQVKVGVFPMGVDVPAHRAQAARPEVQARAAAIRAQANGCRVLLGVDRLDYTKGLPRRMLAMDALLEAAPELRGKIRLIQVAVPSRVGVPAYDTFKRQLDELVGRVNGRWATTDWVPIHALHHGVDLEELTALYLAADVMVVTPLRDGMNLVAKEYVASREDGDGVLVLSEFAGAASEMGEALVVNPYDIAGTAMALRQALEMPEPERRLRFARLRPRVLRHDVAGWARSFLGALEDVRMNPPTPPTSLTSVEGLAATITARSGTGPLMLLLDYDGTLVPLVTDPATALPSPQLEDVLRALAARANTQVHVVSGRAHRFLQETLGHLPVGLHGEHGLWSRVDGTSGWMQAVTPDVEWMPRVLEVLEHWTQRTAGTWVEQKSATLCWHFRQLDPAIASRAVRELRLYLMEVLSNAPVEVLMGHKLLEVRAHGINKGLVVQRLFAAAPSNTCVVAVGDDRTDEDMFAALPPQGIAVRVGDGPSRAPLRLGHPEDVVRLLEALAARHLT